MRLPEYAIKIILLLLFFVAAGTRFSTTSGSMYPYFQGESAMNYRDALSVSQRGLAGVLDRPTPKSNWPEGYRPAREKPVAVEYLAGAAMRAATWLSDEDTRVITRRFVVFWFSLCVFTLYALARNLWRSQTAGLMAAFLAAFFPPLIEATNGREFGHTSVALVVVTLHLLALQRTARGARWSGGAGTAVTAFLLVGAWEISPYYIAAVVAAATILYPMDAARRRNVALVHTAAFLAAAVIFPHARALRIAFSWPSALLVACCVQAVLSARTARLSDWKSAAALVLGVSAVLTLALTPFRSAAESDFPAMRYVYYRLRFLVERPAAPSLLPEQIRWLWSPGHAAPSAQALITFLLPFAFFVPPALAAGRKYGAEGEHAAAIRRQVMLVGPVAAAGVLLYALDRSAVVIASVAAIPLASAAGLLLESGRKAPAVAAAAGASLIVLQLLWPSGGANAALQLSRALGVAHVDKTKILWVSLENTDRELVRFVASGTSTRDPFLGKADLTALLLAFSGRTSVLLEGARSRRHALRNVSMTALLYGEEAELYRQCRELGIRYVVYSIDFLLDTTRYSPAYLAGLAVVPEKCAAVSMHFAPETLTHFNMVYENDHYRLFRVTDEQQPMFITDHPPVYQRDILERHGGDYDTFRDRINQIMLTYTDAMRAADAGNPESALRRLAWCLQQAPMFTKARIAVGTTLLDQEQPGQAKDVFMSILGYAPDNPLALYYAAYSLAQLEETEKALDLLQLLFTTTRDTELLGRARLLRALIQQGQPVSPGRENQSAPPPR